MISRIQQAFKDLHGCEARHVESVPVVLEFEGEPAWEGDVEVFALTDHPRTKIGFGWEHGTDGEQKRVVTVLGIPPASSPKEAVKVAIVAEAKKL